MEIAPLECVFRDCLESCSNGEKCFSSKPLSMNQIDVVINSSHKRHDGFAKRRPSIIIQAVMPHTLRKVRSTNI